MKKVFSGLAALAVCGSLFAAGAELEGLTLRCDGKSFTLAPTRAKEGERTVALRQGAYRPDVYVFMPTKVPARNLLTVEVFDAATGEALKDGTDYKMNPVGGIYPLTKIEPRRVRMKYTFLPERYDALWQTAAGELRYLAGPERDFDAEEHIPVLEGGKRVAVVAVRGEEAELVPCEIPASTYVGKEKLAEFLKKLKAGDTVRVMGYGDSITAVQSARPGYEPGGEFRDRAERYFDRYDAATRKQLPVWTREGVKGTFVKAGWCWGLVDELEKSCGVKVGWQNAGIGGTNSGATKGNGLDPERLDAALAAKPDLVVIAFGMNEIDSPKSQENVTKIIEAFRKAGAEVVVVGIPRCQIRSVEKSNTNLGKAAEAGGAVFVDLGKVSPGVAPRHYCSANQYNHPGITEFATYREVLAGVVKK